MDELQRDRARATIWGSLASPVLDVARFLAEKGRCGHPGLYLTVDRPAPGPSPDQMAAQRIYERYIHRLIVLTRTRLGTAARRVADEEDVAQAAIEGLFQGISRGRFPRLSDRDDLWQIQAMLARRKATDVHRRETRDHLVGEPILGCCSESVTEARGVEKVAETALTPDDAMEFEEELRRRLDQLPKPHYRQVVLWKMEGPSSEEIAEMLGCTDPVCGALPEHDSPDMDGKPGQRQLGQIRVTSGVAPPLLTEAPTAASCRNVRGKPTVTGLSCQVAWCPDCLASQCKPRQIGASSLAPLEAPRLVALVANP